ncbi:hypothetical protein JCM5350_007889 [Sporobolomyces pararoseus]
MSYAPRFEPLKQVRWTASTRVQKIQELVSNREAVFAKHRLLDDPTREAGSLEELKRFALTKTLQSGLNRYIEFCQAVNLPVAPISASSIACFIVAKCSHHDGCYDTARKQLNQFRRAISNLWEDVEGMEQLEDSNEIERALMSFLKERRSKRVIRGSRDTSDESSSEAESGSGDSEVIVPRQTLQKSVEIEEETDTESEDSESQEVEQSIIPDLPQAGESFRSANDFFIACYQAMLPIYGNGVILAQDEDEQSQLSIKCSRSAPIYRSSTEGCCPWKVGAVVNSSTGGVTVDQASSYLHHSHDRAKGIAKDPAWRPPVRNAVIREALGLPSTASKKVLRRTSPSLLSSDSSSSDSSSDSSSASFKKPLKKRKLASASNSPRTSSTAHSRLPQPTALSAPLPSSLYRVQRPLGDPANGSTSSLPLSPSSSPFYPQLEAFLRGLHPPLSSLTSPLFLAGIDSIDTLAAFCAFEPSTVERFLKSIQDKARTMNQPVSILHLRLFVLKLEEAKKNSFDMKVE